jgi:hypothetical protein
MSRYIILNKKKPEGKGDNAEAWLMGDWLDVYCAVGCGTGTCRKLVRGSEQTNIEAD